MDCISVRGEHLLLFYRLDVQPPDEYLMRVDRFYVGLSALVELLDTDT